MNSTLTLFYNCLVEQDKNFILDDNGVNAIETYLQTIQSTRIDNFQYVKQALSLSIKVDMAQVSLCMGEDCDDLNYCKIQNGEQNPCYYFIISKKWLSKNTIELVLSMDTLNTYQYDSDYEISPKTFIKRMHKDRFENFNGSYSTTYEATSGDDVVIEFTSVDFMYSRPKNISVIIYPSSYSSLSTSIITKDSKTYIRVSFHADGSYVYSIGVTYKVYALKCLIDLKSEEINVPTYKRKDETIYEKSGQSTIDWCLYYKTADNQATTPIDCYLVPEIPMEVKRPQNAGEFTTNNVPENEYLLFFMDYNTPNISIDVDGATYTPNTNEINDALIITALALYNDGSKLEVYYGSFVDNPNLGYRGSWTKVAVNPSHVIVLNSPTNVNSRQRSSLPSAIQIYENELYLTSNHVTLMSLIVNSVVKGKNSIDKTLSTNIKIINLPYSPTTFEIDNNNIFSFDSCWSYNTNDGLIKLVDFSKRFTNEIDSGIDNILSVFSVNYYGEFDITSDINRLIDDPKLLHSDFYRPKFVYDSFTKIFPLEQINFNFSDRNSPSFKFTFVMSRNIVSKFLFKFDQFKYSNSKDDYDNVLPVSRNNEEVLYNSQYLDYVRTGYNYDLKSKERTESASGIGIGLNVAGMLASIGASALTSNPLVIGSAIASGIGLASQLVSYAKNTAQNEENIQRKLQESQMQAVSVMNADDSDLLYEYSKNKGKLCVYTCSDRMKNVLNDLFFYCGYVINEQGKPQVNSRRSFNFVQASLIINHANNLTGEIQDDIKEKFENGVTFLHYSFNKFDFNQDKENIERSLL